MSTRVSGFTLVRNGTSFDYPFIESLRSLLPWVDELIVNVGEGEDDTLARVQAFAETEGKGKVVFFESRWPIDDPVKRQGGMILSEQTNLAMGRCTGDWCIYLQADEVLHEKDLPVFKAALSEASCRSEVEGLLFDYIHFYGSFDVIQHSRSAYRREVRAIRRTSGALSVGDAQSFRKPDGQKLRVIRPGLRIYHYGWVRTPEAMKAKTFFMDQLYHGDPTARDAMSKQPHTGENYRYKRFWGLRAFKGEHPAVMKDRVFAKGWRWDLENSPLVWNWRDLKRVALDLLERGTGWRAFEYRSYRLIGNSKVSLDRGPVATVLVATYEMPGHLAMVCAALERQSFKQFEVLICDDGSGPETATVVRGFAESAPFPVRHLWQEHRGFRKCRILNRGLRDARGETLIFLDGDCIPHRDFVQDHVSLQEDGYFLAGRRVELGPKISEWITPGRIRNGFFDFPHWRLIWSVVRGDSTHLQRSLRIPCPRVRKMLGMDKIDDLKGCNYSVSREVLVDRLNGFDQAYEGYGREDTDVEIRLQNAGLKIKSLKGVALQFHVWHPRREFTPANDERLEDARRSGRIRCQLGLDAVAGDGPSISPFGRPTP